MKLEKRLKRLEEVISVNTLGPELDKELTRWILDNPGWLSQQPEGQKILMPRSLSLAWKVRLDLTFEKHGLGGNLSDLSAIWTEVYP